MRAPCVGCGLVTDCYEGLCVVCRLANDEALAESLERAIEREDRFNEQDRRAS